GLKALGAEWVISISAVGSMKEAIRHLDLVIPDQCFGATRRRVASCFGDGVVAHVGMAEPVCPDLATVLEKAARQTGATVHRGGTYLCIEGPQFSTKAESRIYRGWGVDVIGMTNLPEAKLAREAELCYATLALATDYDVWHDTHDAVTVDAVIENLLQNVETAKSVLSRLIPAVGPPRTCACPTLLARAVITAPAAFPLATRRRPPRADRRPGAASSWSRRTRNGRSTRFSARRCTSGRRTWIGRSSSGRGSSISRATSSIRRRRRRPSSWPRASRTTPAAG